MKWHNNLLFGVIEGLDEIFLKNKYANKVVKDIIDKNKKWGSRDRNLVSETIFECVRWYRKYIYCSGLEKLSKQKDLWNLLGTYIIIEEQVLPKIIQFSKINEEKINMFAEISGKSRDAVVGFLNGLEEDAVAGGIQMFGKKVAEQNKFTGARKDAIAQGKDSFEVDGKMYKITGDTSDEEDQAKNESMFDDIITDMLAEEVEVEQAEVIMAARALADDVQDQIARLGKMVNEDLPAIADQMRAEMGAEVAQGFNDTMVQAIDGHLVASKAVKQSMDDAIGGLTGDAPMQPAMMDEPMDAPMDASLDGEVDAMAEPDAMDVNDPAAAGPEEEPLGRAPVDAEGV